MLTYLNMTAEQGMPRPLPSLGTLLYFTAPQLSLVIVCLETVTLFLMHGNHSSPAPTMHVC